MDTKDIEQLIQLLEKSSISEIEVSRMGKKIRVSRSPQGLVVNQTPAPTAPVVSAEPIVAEPAPVESPKINGEQVRAPMVGTFYRSPSPEADPFVKVGDRVKKGQTLCIIEAMKIMNEVEAETGGVVTDIQVENAQPVEYNQVLFVVEP